MFEAVFALANTIRVDIHEAAGRNIKKLRKNRNAILIVGTYPQQMLKWGIDIVGNKRRHDRKGERVQSFHIDV